MVFNNRGRTNGLKCYRDVTGSLFSLRLRELLIDAMAGGNAVFSPVVNLKYGYYHMACCC